MESLLAQGYKKSDQGKQLHREGAAVVVLQRKGNTNTNVLPCDVAHKNIWHKDLDAKYKV